MGRSFGVDGRAFGSDGRGFIAGPLLQVCDSYEDNDLSEYDKHIETDQEFITLHAADAPRSQPAYDGEYVAKFGGNIGVGDDGAAHSTSNLPIYPSRGKPHGVYVNPNALHDIYYHFAVKSDHTDWKYPTSYSIRVYGDGGGSPAVELWYENRNTSTSTILDSAVFDTTNYVNNWSLIYVDWDTAGDGVIAADVIDTNGTVRGSVSKKHTALDKGGIGLAGVSQTPSDKHVAIWYDLIHVE